jgi:hypothetical protein
MRAALVLLAAAPIGAASAAPAVAAQEGPAGGAMALDLACTAEGKRSGERRAIGRHGGDGVSLERRTGMETIDVSLLRCG